MMLLLYRQRERQLGTPISHGLGVIFFEQLNDLPKKSLVTRSARFRKFLRKHYALLVFVESLTRIQLCFNRTNVRFEPSS